MGGAENPPPAPQHDATAPRKRKDSLDKLARKDSKRSKKAKAQLNSILSRLDALEKVASGSVEVVYAENGDGDGGDDDAEPDEDEDEDKDEAIELMLEEIMVEMSSFNTACISALCTRGAARRTAPSRKTPGSGYHRERRPGTTEAGSRRRRGDDADIPRRRGSSETGEIRDAAPNGDAERRLRDAKGEGADAPGRSRAETDRAISTPRWARRRRDPSSEYPRVDAATGPRNIHASPRGGAATRPRNIHAAPRPRRNVEDARSPRAGRADRRGSRCSVY